MEKSINIDDYVIDMHTSQGRKMGKNRKDFGLEGCLVVNEEKDLFVYRPLAYVAETDCEKFSKQMDYPIIPCDLCGSQDGLQRQQVKKIIDGWEKNSPGRRQVMFRSLMNTKPSHLLDTNLFDFLGLQRELIDEHKIQSDPKIRDIVE